MAREFRLATGGLTTVNAGLTLTFVNPAAAPNFNLEFLRFWVGQNLNATSAQQRVQVETQASVFPTLVSQTPSKLKLADPNASIIAGGTAGAAGTCGVNASAEGAGSKTVTYDDSFNVLTGFLHVPGPNETLIAPAGFTQGVGLFLPAAPIWGTTGGTWGLVYREV